MQQLRAGTLKSLTPESPDTLEELSNSNYKQLKLVLSKLPSTLQSLQLITEYTNLVSKPESDPMADFAAFLDFLGSKVIKSAEADLKLGFMKTETYPKVDIVSLSRSQSNKVEKTSNKMS